MHRGVVSSGIPAVLDVRGAPVTAQPEPARSAPNATGRLEAFSDGVLAIVMTLLVLDLRVPTAGQADHGLAHYLLHQRPSFTAYLASFLVVRAAVGDLAPTMITVAYGRGVRR